MYAETLLVIVGLTLFCSFGAAIVWASAKIFVNRKTKSGIHVNICEECGGTGKQPKHYLLPHHSFECFACDGDGLSEQGKKSKKENAGWVKVDIGILNKILKSHFSFDLFQKRCEHFRIIESAHSCCRVCDLIEHVKYTDSCTIENCPILKGVLNG